MLLFQSDSKEAKNLKGEQVKLQSLVFYLCCAALLPTLNVQVCKLMFFFTCLLYKIIENANDKIFFPVLLSQKNVSGP